MNFEYFLVSLFKSRPRLAERLVPTAGPKKHGTKNRKTTGPKSTVTLPRIRRENNTGASGFGPVVRIFYFFSFVIGIAVEIH